MKKEMALLRVFIRGDYRLAICKQRVCEILMNRRQFFTDDFMARVALSFVVFHGQWESVKADVESWRHPRAKKFCQWAEQVRGGAL